MQISKKHRNLGYVPNKTKIYDKCSPLRGSPESRSPHRTVEVIHHDIIPGPPRVTHFIEEPIPPPAMISNFSNSKGKRSSTKNYFAMRSGRN
tara:strand:- start:483 stop:758 length:276 start_codon:yes stop_codon:yes gene_type:complete